MFKGFFFFMKFGWHADKRYVLYNILNQIIRSMIPVVSVIMPKYIIDELVGKQRLEVVTLYTTGFAAFLLLANSLCTWLSLQGFTLRAKAATDWGAFIHRKLIDADYEYLENPQFLDLKEKANKFLYGDWHGFSYLFDCSLDIAGQALTLCGIVYMIASLNLWMVVLSVVLVLVSTFVESIAKKKEMELSAQAVSIERGWTYYSQLMEDFQYGKEIRINNLGDWLLQKEKDYGYTAVDFYRRRNHYHIRSGIISAFMTFIQQLAAYAYVIRLIQAHALTIGDFTLYIGAITTFSNGMRKIMQDFIEIRAFGIYFDAVQQYVHVPSKQQETGRGHITGQQHVITFEHVSFRYHGQTQYALQDIDFTISCGEKLAIVGENGAGKTTLIKLLTRFYEPEQGRILLDGKDIRELDYQEYMAQFAAVFQDYKLFAMTLSENICLACPDSAGQSSSGINHSRQRITAILQKVGLDRQPDTPVYKIFDASGFEPSGGEGQKIALARALYKNAPIVILDEPAAALDPKAEYELYQQLNAMTAGKTTLYISHRLSSTRFCDKIIVLKEGRIVETGTHDSLISKPNGIYQELYHMQAQYYQTP